MEERISSIELTPVHVPFKKAVRELMAAGEGGLGMAIGSDEPWLGGDFVICKIETSDGTTGLGEAFVWLPETGVSPAQIIDAIQHGLARHVIGEDPRATGRIRARMDANVARSDVAKGLIDMACHELAAKLHGIPVHDLIGGKQVDLVPLAALVPLTDLDTMVLLARMFQRMGYTTLRLKLGRGAGEDARTVEAIREVVGTGTRLRVDYNQAYTPGEAVKAIRGIEPFTIDYAEQPVGADDYLGMAHVQRQVTVPLMAHEGFFTVKDFDVLAELGAVGVLGINSERPGGVLAALRAIDHAVARDMTTVIHNQPLGIGTAMHLHLATARHASLGHATEVFGDFMWDDDLITTPVRCKRGKATLPPGPGWGVELDETALARHATGPATIITR